MKAAQDFVIHVNSNGDMIGYKSGEEPKPDKTINIKKGDIIPDDYVKEFLMFNREYLDIDYVDGHPKLTEKEKEKYDTKKPEPLVGNIYTQEELIKIKNKEGLEGLKKIGTKFGVTDRSKKNLITEILEAQDKSRREGK